MTKNKKLLSDNLLVDYLERELEPNLSDQVETVLRSSKVDSKRLEELSLTRAMVTEADPYKNRTFRGFSVEDQVMAKIYGLSPQPKKNWLSQRGWVQVAAVMALVVGGGLGSQLVDIFHKAPKNAASIVEVSVSHLDAFEDTVLNPGVESDFYLESLGRRQTLADAEAVF